MAQFGGVCDHVTLLMTGKRVGNNVFYPLTLGASIWYQDVVCGGWFEDDDDSRGLALLYVLAHSRDPESYLGIETEKDCRKIIRKWAKGCNVTESEAFVAIHELLPSAYPVESDAQPCGECGQDVDAPPMDIMGNIIEEPIEDIIPMFAILQRYYGETREYWLNQPCDVAKSMAEEAIKQVNAERGVESSEGDNHALAGAYHLLKCRERILAENVK